MTKNTSAEWADVTAADAETAPGALVGASTADHGWNSLAIEPLRLADGFLWLVERPGMLLASGIAATLEAAKAAAETVSGRIGVK
jgi:hypothetical protein